MVIVLTENEVSWVKSRYPDLKFNQQYTILSGYLGFDRSYEGCRICDNYQIEINFDGKVGSIMPTVREIDGKIEKTAEKLSKSIIDLHMNATDKTLCLCNLEEETLRFPNGFKIDDFFEQILEPYLYWESYLREYNIPPWEGCAHGRGAYLEMYAENKINIRQLSKYYSTNELFKIKHMKGHHPCLCGSNRRMRNCHLLIYSAIYKLKKEFYGQS